MTAESTSTAATTDEPDPIGDLLRSSRTVALVGASANPERPSWDVLRAMLGRGFDVYPVNPGLAGQDLLGRAVYAKLAEIPVPIDIVDIFRAPDAAGKVVDEALALAVLPKAVWMQLGIVNEAAAERARSAGVRAVMDHCIAVESRTRGIRLT